MLFGQGFASHLGPTPTPGDDTATDAPALFAVPPAINGLFPAPDDATPPSDDGPAPLTITAPGGSTTTVVHTTAGGPSFTGYFTRPAASITLPGQRIRTVSTRRNDTAATVAQREDANTGAVMYANGITDPTQTLALGQVLRIPPPGTMLHRVKESDTLESIARAYRVGVDAITGYAGNTVRQSGDLVPGDYLIIPTLHLPMRDRVIFYQVREGDTLFKISGLYNLGDPQTLKWANSLPSADFVQPGQIVAVPPVDGVIHVVEPVDALRTTEDAITQIAKNFACTEIPCNETPSDERVNALAAAIFAFGPNHLTHGGKLIVGQEIVIPGGKPFVEPPPVVIPRNVVLDDPDTIPAASTSTSGGSGRTTTTTTTTTRRTTTTASGATTTTTITTGDNYGSGTGNAIAATASRYLGQYRQPSGLPWAFWCEKFVGDVADQAGIRHTRYPTAIADAYAGKLYGGRAPAGSLVFFDQSWNVAGHVGIAMGDGTMVSALGNGVVRTAYEGSSGYMGWRPFP